MTIRRDDLLAAAAAGLLQYRQVDPLLVFLLQRDISARRQAMLDEVRPRQVERIHAILSFVVAALAVVTAVLFTVLLLSGRATRGMGNGSYMLFALVYAAAGVAIAAWFRRRGYTSRIRLLIAFALASAPLAVVALQQVST